MAVVGIHMCEGALAGGGGHVGCSSCLGNVEEPPLAELIEDAMAFLEKDGVPGSRDDPGDGRGESAGTSGVPAEDAEVLLACTSLVPRRMGLLLTGLRAPRGEPENLCHGTLVLSLEAGTHTRGSAWQLLRCAFLG